MAARDFLKDLILNKYVNLSDTSLEKYGRLLASVSYQGRDLSRMMLDRGHAVAYDGGTKKAFAASPEEVV